MRRASFALGIALIVPAIWCAVAWWYWQRFIPLPPQRILWRDGRQISLNLENRGQVALYRDTGPIQIVNVPDGRVLREILTPEDQVRAVLPGRPGIAVALRGAEYRVVNLETGETRCLLPRVERDTTFMLALRGDVLLVRFRSSMTVFDLRSGAELWSVENVHSVVTGERGGGDVILLGTSEPANDSLHRRRSRTTSSFVNVLTGRPDPRYRDVENGAIDFSPDGRHVLIRNFRIIQVLDAVTCEPRWTIEKTTDGVPRFNDDGSEVQIRYQQGESGTRVARWATEDGRVLSPLPPRVRMGSPAVSFDGRYSVAPMPFSPLPRAVVHAENWLKRQGVKAWDRPERILAIVDNEADEFVAPLAGTATVSNYSVVLDMSGQGLIVPMRHAILYYALPPKRSVRWLVERTAIPVGAVWIVVAAVWALRAKRNRNAALDGVGSRA